MIDLEALRLQAHAEGGDVVVTRRWLRQALRELTAARIANESAPPATLDLEMSQVSDNGVALIHAVQAQVAVEFAARDRRQLRRIR